MILQRRMTRRWKRDCAIIFLGCVFVVSIVSWFDDNKLLYTGISSLDRYVKTADLPEWSKKFQPGRAEKSNDDYSRTVVMATVASDDLRWWNEELGDIAFPNGTLQLVPYVADDPSALYHTITNKGNEAMVYLTFIIDHYHNLSDVTFFTHSDRFTWHNNILMDHDQSLVFRHFNLSKVIVNGYVNLLCDWQQTVGCFKHIQLVNPPTFDANKQDEHALYFHWHELFPSDPRPLYLAQPCCSQFALSRDRIQSVPLERYKHLQNWILTTTLDDYASGRVFEYIWQFIWTGQSTVCPDQRICYCETYGICFPENRTGGQSTIEDWFAMRDAVLKAGEIVTKFEKATATKEKLWEADNTYYVWPDGLPKWSEKELLQEKKRLEVRKKELLALRDNALSWEYDTTKMNGLHGMFDLGDIKQMKWKMKETLINKNKHGQKDQAMDLRPQDESIEQKGI